MKENTDSKHDVVISYRRDGGEHLAWRYVGALKKRGYRAFMDADLRSGQFDKQLYYVIDNCKDFILVLTPNALDRCVSDEDWVRLEIERAKEDNKNIVPIKTKDFKFPDELPDSLMFLKKQQTIELYSRLFDDFIDRILIPMLVSKPTKPKRQTKPLRILAGFFCICAFVLGFLYILKPPPFASDLSSTSTMIPTAIDTQTEELIESERNPSEPVPKETENVPMQDITLFAPENMSVKNFKSAIEILKGRLDIFTDIYPYEINVSLDNVYLSLPKASFEDHDVMYIMRAYLSRATELYIYSDINKTEIINVSRKDIESVILMHGTILGVDASEYGINKENYPFIRIVLTNEFVDKYHEQISEWGKHLTFGQDMSLDQWYYYNTFPKGDGKTFFLLNTDGEHLSKLSVYNLNHNSYSNNFHINIPVNITWENTEEIASPGSYQCNSEDLTGDTVQIIYKTLESYAEKMTEGEWLDTQSAFKKRFDALEQPYCFGMTDNTYEIAVKTVIAHYSETVLNLAGETFLRYRMQISSGLNQIGYSPDEFSIHQEDNGNWKIVLSISNKQGIEVMNNFVKMAANQGKELICQIDSIPWFKANADDISKSGEIRFDKLYLDGSESIGSEYSWLMRYLETVTNGPKMPYPYDISQITYDTENEIRDLRNYGKENTVLEKNILKVVPEAEVIFNQESIRIFLNLHVDSDLPQKAAETGQRIFESIPFENCPYNGITIYLIDEDDSTRERARIIFRKHFSSYYSADDFSGSDDESYCYVFGAFNGGRLNELREDFLTIIENNSFYQHMRHKEMSWF